MIDHIYTNITENIVTPGILLHDISDHFPIFCIVHNSVSKMQKLKNVRLERKKFEKAKLIEDA